MTLNEITRKLIRQNKSRYILNILNAKGAQQISCFFFHICGRLLGDDLWKENIFLHCQPIYQHKILKDKT